ncbi:MAG: DUF4386 domain-containing protein, partial [Candidatus Eisenbacteria bacterium]
MEDGMTSIRKQARIAGALYLLMGVTAPIGLLVVPGRLIESGNATATADRIRASEWLLRAGIASELFHQVIAIFLVFALYRLFKSVSERLAVQLVVLGALVSVPIMFVNVVNELAALMLVRGAPFLAPFDRPQLDALAYLFVRLHSKGIDVASIFWGLWLFPFGLLVIRSGFIPKLLGALLIIGGIGYLAAAAISLVLPPGAATTMRSVAGILELGELP